VPGTNHVFDMHTPRLHMQMRESQDINVRE